MKVFNIIAFVWCFTFAIFESWCIHKGYSLAFHLPALILQLAMSVYFGVILAKRLFIER